MNLKELCLKVRKRFSINSELMQRLASGAFWTLLGNLISRFLSVAAMIVLARLLGTSEFGEFSVLQSTLLTLQTLSGLGLGWAATRYVAKYKLTDLERVGRVSYFSENAALIAGCVCALILIFGADWVAEHVLEAQHLASLLKIISFSIALSATLGVKNGILMGLGKFRWLAYFNVFSGCWTFLLVVGGGWFFGLLGAALALALAAALDFFLMSFISRRAFQSEGISKTRQGAWSERAMFWEFGLPAVIGGGVFQLAIWFSSVLLVRQPSGYSEMGFYAAANQWFSALMFLPTIISQAAVPLISERLGVGDFGNVKRIFTNSLIANSSIVFGVVFLGSLFSPWIMGLYGPSYADKWPTLIFLLVAAGLAAIQAPAAQIISSSGRMWFALVMQISFAIVFCGLSFFLVGYGSAGMAVARVFAYVAYAGASFYFAMYLFEKMNLPKSVEG